MFNGWFMAKEKLCGILALWWLTCISITSCRWILTDQGKMVNKLGSTPKGLPNPFFCIKKKSCLVQFVGTESCQSKGWRIKKKQCQELAATEGNPFCVRRRKKAEQEPIAMTSACCRLMRLLMTPACLLDMTDRKIKNGTGVISPVGWGRIKEAPKSWLMKFCPFSTCDENTSVERWQKSICW